MTKDPRNRPIREHGDGETVAGRAHVPSRLSAFVPMRKKGSPNLKRSQAYRAL